MTEHDIEDLYQQTSVFYSLGDDFDYSVRVNALKFVKHLGKGGFGEVNLCTDELTGDQVAVKYLNFSLKKISNQMIKKEVEALSGLKHKNIVKLLDAVPMAEEKQLIVIMEYLAGGELYEYWKRFKHRQMPEREVAEIMLQLASALGYCHDNKVIHRDIKFQNVVLLEQVNELPTAKTAPSKVHVKIADFGIFGSNAGTIAEKHNAGSIKYMAPELLQGDNASNPKIDIWSLGILMYAMILGKCPFDGDTREQIKEIIINKEVSFTQQKRLLQTKLAGTQKISMKPPQRVSILKTEIDSQDNQNDPFLKASKRMN